MAAPLGNKNGTKLKEKDLRQRAYRAFCKWLESGKPEKAFTFEESGHSACYRTLQKYIEEDPIEFPPILMQMAKAKRFDRWFSKGEDMVDGKIKGNYSPVIWQTIMRNMFKEEGWDVPDMMQGNLSNEKTQVIVQEIENGAPSSQPQTSI